MDQLVAEDGSMEGVQTPVASSREKKVCGTCRSEFTSQSNLNRHVETKHTDQNTPEAVAKRLKLHECRNNTRRERRANDPVYREKEKQISRTNRMNKKACPVAGDGVHTGGVSNDTKAKDESIPFETEKKGDGMWIPTDVVDTLQPLPTAPMIVGVLGEDGVSATGERVKKARKKDKTKGVPGRVETMALTTANVASFFAPKYGAPRSKEQRAETPRPSAI
jgi:hypothetical protein